MWFYTIIVLYFWLHFIKVGIVTLHHLHVLLFLFLLECILLIIDCLVVYWLLTIRLCFFWNIICRFLSVYFQLSLARTMLLFFWPWATLWTTVRSSLSCISIIIFLLLLAESVLGQLHHLLWRCQRCKVFNRVLVGGSELVQTVTALFRRARCGGQWMQLLPWRRW